MEKDETPFVCPIADEWKAHRERTMSALDKIDKMDAGVNEMVRNSKHWESLNALTDIRDKLLDSATGRNHIDITTFRWVVLILIGCILFLLTGEHFNIFHLVK